MATPYTLSYDSGIQGWVSFYSYEPEKIIGMNNYLYTFKGGNLFQHNTNNQRNVFYGITDPAIAKSTVTSVVNQQPLVNKVYKAFYLESDDSWESTFLTDKITGFINADYYEKKESDYFAFIRTTELPPSGSGLAYDIIPALQLRSVIGIGEAGLTNVVGATEWRINMPDSTLDPVFISTGNIIYDAANVPNPRPIGSVTALDFTANEIVVNPSTVGALVPPFVGDVLFSVKSSIGESNGLLGHYLEFTLTNTSTDPVELFAVGADVMISNPSPRQS